jgi:hypothetical protein
MMASNPQVKLTAHGTQIASAVPDGAEISEVSRRLGQKSWKGPLRVIKAGQDVERGDVVVRRRLASWGRFLRGDLHALWNRIDRVSFSPSDEGNGLYV